MYCTECALWRAKPVSAMIPYHRTEQGTNGTHLVLVCTWVYPHILPFVHGFTRTPYRRSSLAVVGVPHRGRMSSHLSAWRELSASWSRHWSALIGGARAGMRVGTTLGQSPGHGPGDRCKAINVAEFGARRFRSLELSCQKWSGAASGYHSQVTQWSRPNQSGRFGLRHRFGVMPPPCTPGSIKVRWRGHP